MYQNKRRLLVGIVITIVLILTQIYTKTSFIHIDSRYALNSESQYNHHNSNSINVTAPFSHSFIDHSQYDTKFYFKQHPQSHLHTIALSGFQKCLILNNAQINAHVYIYGLKGTIAQTRPKLSRIIDIIESSAIKLTEKYLSEYSDIDYEV